MSYTDLRIRPNASSAARVSRPPSPSNTQPQQAGDDATPAPQPAPAPQGTPPQGETPGRNDVKRPVIDGFERRPSVGQATLPPSPSLATLAASASFAPAPAPATP